LKAISDEDETGGPAEDLLSMEGMTEELAHELAENGIKTMEDLAEQSVDDLLEITKLNEQKAAELIMTARAPWFTDAQG
jgi:N utilization substance protein A